MNSPKSVSGSFARTLAGLANDPGQIQQNLLDTNGRFGTIGLIRGKRVRKLFEVAVVGTERQFQIRPDAAAREGAP